jgi:hypothetical protein
VGEPEERRPLGRPMRRWEDKSKMDLRETGWRIMDWIDLVQDRDSWWAREYGNEPLGFIKCGELLE